MIWLYNDGVVTKNRFTTEKMQLLKQKESKLSCVRYYQFDNVRQEKRKNICIDKQTDEWFEKFEDRGTVGKYHVYDITSFKNNYAIILRIIKQALMVDCNFVPRREINLANFFNNGQSLASFLETIELMLLQDQFDEKDIAKNYAVFYCFLKEVFDYIKISTISEYKVRGNYVQLLTEEKKEVNVSPQTRFQILEKITNAENNQKILDMSYKLKKNFK